MLLGLAFGIYAGLWQLGVAPGSRVEMPLPVALERAGAGRDVSLDVPDATMAPASTASSPFAEPTPAPLSTAASARPAVVSTPVPALHPPAVADADDRRAVQAPKPGLAVRLVIPSIQLDSEVAQAGIRRNQQGNLEWETMPFIAVHYAEDTAKIGARGNAVIAGHVVTLGEGNVFRNLYRVDLHDEIQVWDDGGRLRRYQVTRVRLVAPSDISVMAPTLEETLTLITCGGAFDPVTREFSDRLIVIAKPIHDSASSGPMAQGQ